MFQNFSLFQNWIMLMLVLQSASAYRQQPSNVVFIMVDDMGWNDVSFHGSDQIMTPNIDMLAYQGVILQQYYSEAICTPARTALLTGKYPMRLGMHGTPLFNSENRGIPLTERLLPSYLKDYGYATHLVGKWHVGMSMDDYLPTSRGYDTHYGMRGGFVDYYTYNKVEDLPDGRTMFGLDLFDNGIPQNHEHRYIVDALTDRAVSVIHRHNASKPLFLHVTHNAPHAGNNGAALQPPLYGSVKNRHIADSNRRLYSEVVNQIDRSVGQIVRALAEKNILEDTIIVFVSDNGAPTVGNFRNWGVNLPFRGTKETPWEGAVRVPAFIWHSEIRPRVWDGLMHITDWMPTLIAAAGGQVKNEIDGVNQWDAIVQDGESKRNEVLITIEDSSTNAFAAYRAGDYKIVIGNVTGLNNNHYGADFLINKSPTPEYFAFLKSCEVARVFEYSGKLTDLSEAMAMRAATIVQRQDTVRDATLCLPTPTKGCLFNVRRDPDERHDLWLRAEKIAILLTSRLRSFWLQQTRRGPTNIQNASDPANYGYTWMPWVDRSQTIAQILRSAQNISTSNLRFRQNVFRNASQASLIDCEGSTYLRNFLCILRSVF